MVGISYTFFLWLIAFFTAFSLSAQSADTKLFLLKKKEAVVCSYKKGHYAKANRYIEELLPLLTSSQERLQFQFYQAYCNFYEKNYLVSSGQFHLLVKHYPTFPEREEAFFMRGYSMACEEVPICLDQKVTYDAIAYLTHYISTYPTGAYLDQAHAKLADLQQRLMEKQFKMAAFYVQLRYYRAATIALQDFARDYPDSPFQSELFQLLLKIYEKLSLLSSNDEVKKQEIAEHLSNLRAQMVHPSCGSNTKNRRK